MCPPFQQNSPASTAKQTVPSEQIQSVAREQRRMQRLSLPVATQTRSTVPLHSTSLAQVAPLLLPSHPRAQATNHITPAARRISPNQKRDLKPAASPSNCRRKPGADFQAVERVSIIRQSIGVKGRLRRGSARRADVNTGPIASGRRQAGDGRRGVRTIFETCSSARRTQNAKEAPHMDGSIGSKAHVVVVGGGLAGCAAATILAERGAQVTLIEKQTFLGGRAGSWPDRLSDGTEFSMERGFHAFFRQYYNLRALFRRFDPALRFLKPQRDYPLLGPSGWTESFARLPTRTPLNLLTLIWRTPSLGLRDLLRIDVGAATRMLEFDPERTYRDYDLETAGDYLDSLRFPRRARQMLFDIFAHSFFNPEQEYSAAELLAMFHFYFLGNQEGLIFDTANAPFEEAIWTPLREYLSKLGVRFRLGEGVTRLERDVRGFVAHTTTEPTIADGCVLATSVPALQALVAASTGLDEPSWTRSVQSLGVTRPFVVWRLWTDRPLRSDRAPFAGTTGVGILDNISIYEKLEGESRAWSDRTGGSVLELHAYSVEPRLDADSIKRSMLDGLYEVYPEARECQILEERYLHMQDCPSFAPGSFDARPTPETPIPGLALAGDFVKMPFASALMERAVSSGFMAANHLLPQLGLERTPEPIASIPRRGVLARGGVPLSQLVRSRKASSARR